MSCAQTDNFQEWMEWVESSQEVDDELRGVCNEVKDYFSEFVIGDLPDGTRCRVRRFQGVSEVSSIFEKRPEAFRTLNSVSREGDVYSLRFYSESAA